MAPMLLTAVESIVEGATKEQVEAAWAHVNGCMAKVPGFTRQQASWSTDGKAFITEVFETPADYLAFMGLVDLPLVTKAIKFEEVRLQASNDQVVALGDLVTNFGMKVFYTDGLPGLHRELERRVDSSMP